MSGVDMTATALSGADLAVDHALSDIATSFRFLLEVTPTDLASRRETFWKTRHRASVLVSPARR